MTGHEAFVGPVTFSSKIQKNDAQIVKTNETSYLETDLFIVSPKQIFFRINIWIVENVL